MNQDQIQTSIEKQLKNKNIQLLIDEIMLKQGLNQKVRNLYHPESDFLQILVLYFILRKQNKLTETGTKIKIAQMHHKITKQLNSYNLNFKQKQKNLNHSFPQKIVILSLLLPILANNVVKQFSLETINSQDCFITLLYLSTGKFVSLKTFQLCKAKMRKKFASKVYSTYPSIKIIKKDFSKTKTSFYKSQIQNFKEQLKSILCPQINPKTPFQSQKSFFSKSSKMSNTNSNLMKSRKQKFTQISENTSIDNKPRSQTLATQLTKIKKRVSVDQIIKKQKSAKKSVNSNGVKFLLKKESFMSLYTHQNSLHFSQSTKQQRVY